VEKKMLTFYILTSVIPYDVKITALEKVCFKEAARTGSKPPAAFAIYLIVDVGSGLALFEDSIKIAWCMVGAA